MKGHGTTMGYYGAEQFHIDLQKDFAIWFIKRQMEACRQAIENQPSKISIASAVMNAHRAYAFSDDKSFMQLASTAKGALRDEIIAFFNSNQFIMMFRTMNGALKKLTADCNAPH